MPRHYCHTPGYHGALSGPIKNRLDLNRGYSARSGVPISLIGRFGCIPQHIGLASFGGRRCIAPYDISSFRRVADTVRCGAQCSTPFLKPMAHAREAISMQLLLVLHRKLSNSRVATAGVIACGDLKGAA